MVAVLKGLLGVGVVRENKRKTRPLKRRQTYSKDMFMSLLPKTGIPGFDVLF